jgi:hypothetical protein
MAADITPVAPRLAQLLRVLSTDKDHEALAAVKALLRTLKSVGADIHVIASMIEQPPNDKLSKADMKRLFDAGFAAGYAAAEDTKFGSNDFHDTSNGGGKSVHEMALYCQDRAGRLSEKEQEFISSVAARTIWRTATPKQEKWLRSIYLKLGGKP